MKKTSLVILFSTLVAGGVYAGTQTGQTQMALSLPQPCTIVICTAGLAFFRYITRRIP